MFEIICERELMENDDNPAIIVRLGKPVKEETEFVCAFQIVGLDNSRIQYVRGMDCFQALQLALEVIRMALNASGKTLTWIGGEKGDHGFPRYVPYYFGLPFSQRLNNIIDQELERLGEAIRKT